MHKTGHPEIDRDHFMIVESIDLLSKDIVYWDRDLRIKIIERILDYATHHLNREERLMCVMDYPGYRSHCTAHEELQDAFMKFVKPALKGQMERQALITILKDTFLTHTETLDDAFVNWMKEKTKF